MHDALFPLAGNGHGLLVPAVGQLVDLAKTEIVQISLIRVEKVKILLGDQANELLLDLAAAELRKIHQQNACIDVAVRVHAKRDLSVTAELRRAAHELLRSCADNAFAHVDRIHLGNIPKHHEVAIQVDDLVVLREKRGDKEAVVGDDREVIHVLEAGLDLLHLAGDVHEIDGKALLLVLLDQADVLFVQAGVEHDQAIGKLPRGVCDQRTDRHVEVGNVVVIGGKKDWNFTRGVMHAGAYSFFAFLKIDFPYSIPMFMENVKKRVEKGGLLFLSSAVELSLYDSTNRRIHEKSPVFGQNGAQIQFFCRLGRLMRDQSRITAWPATPSR